MLLFQTLTANLVELIYFLYQIHYHRLFLCGFFRIGVISVCAGKSLKSISVIIVKLVNSRIPLIYIIFGIKQCLYVYIEI